MSSSTPRRLRACLAGLALLALLSLARGARAEPVALTVTAGPSAYASTWRGDYGAGGTLRAGVRFAQRVGLEFQGWESYATVNRRVNTGLSLGIGAYLPLARVRPFARLFAIHQHEESLVSVENAPAGVVLGVGSGIRHRAGGGLTLGAELPLSRVHRRVDPAFNVSANAMWFPDDLGPRWTFGLDLGVALSVIP